MGDYQKFTTEQIYQLLTEYRNYLTKFNVTDNDFHDILKNYPSEIYQDFIAKIPAMIGLGLGISDIVDIAMFVGMLWERSRRNDSV